MSKTEDKTEVQKRFSDILMQGIFKNIYNAETDIALYKKIGDHKQSLEDRNYEDLFGFYQNRLIENLVLSVEKIFAKEKVGKYQVRSLCALLKLLEEKSNELTIFYRYRLEQEFSELGFDRKYLQDLCEPQFTQLIADYFRQNLPTGDEAIKKMKVLRDKRVAHDEEIDDKEIENPLWEDLEKLLEYAKHAMGVLGTHYLNSWYYGENGKYFFSTDVQKRANALSRLFRDAGITEVSSE